MSSDRLSEIVGFDVSRETYDRLTEYHDLLVLWSKTHNLIGPKEVSELWERHIADSLQLWPFVQNAKTVLDIGSGAGLPGLVLSCCAGSEQKIEFILVESNAKRCAFLRHVGRELSLPIAVMNTRMESVSRETIDVITARAVTDLSGLISYSEKWLEKSTTGVFLKGRNWKSELTAAQHCWNLKSDTTPSRTDSEGVILRVSEVQRV